MAKETKLEKYVLPRLDEIKAWVEAGHDEKSIAGALGIGYSTFRDYKRSCGALSTALEKARSLPSEAVENSLYKRATGYDYEETTDIYRLIDGEMKLYEQRRYKRHLPGDVRAQTLWLINKEGWVMRTEDGGTGEGDYGVVVLPAATDGEEEGGGLDGP